MFTGIIQKIGAVQALEERQGGRRLVLNLTPWDRPYEAGESIAVNGVCLTLAGQTASGGLVFDVLAETLRKTNLGGLRAGGSVNLERALRYGDSLGGHLVSGHVDGRGTVRGLRPAGGDLRVEIVPPSEVYLNLVEQGSVACDGISLTVAELLPDAFAVHLIPTTLRETVWGGLSEGDAVNLEADMVCKIVRREAARGQLPGGWTWERFQKEGASA